jgi:hypothetical protein
LVINMSQISQMNRVNDAKTAKTVTTDFHDKEVTRLAPPVNRRVGEAVAVPLGLRV